jgi:hypothetical protein
VVVLTALGGTIATVTFVTHQALVPLSKLLLEVRDNGLPVVRILTALFFIKTNDIATIFYSDFLDFKRCWIFGVAALSGKDGSGRKLIEQSKQSLMGIGSRLQLALLALGMTPRELSDILKSF